MLHIVLPVHNRSLGDITQGKKEKTMPHTAARFAALKSELANRLLKTASDFAAERGLAEFQSQELHQMSAGLSDVAGELLMFGADIWPIREAQVVVPFPSQIRVDTTPQRAVA